MRLYGKLNKMYCRHKKPIFSGAIMQSWLRPIGKNSMLFLRTTTCYRLLSMRTVGDNLRNGSCDCQGVCCRHMLRRLGSPTVRVESATSEYQQQSFPIQVVRLYCCCYEFNVACGESPRHTWVYCVPCGVCNQRNLAKRKGQAKKNTSAIYLFISFWQNALAKYALELGHHTICEQTCCCVQ